MRKQGRRRRIRLGSSMTRVTGCIGVLKARPLLACVLSLFMLIIIWSILTRSLPYALGSAQPDLALKLNPDNPIALIAKAENLRKKLVEIATMGERMRPVGHETRPAGSEYELIAARDALRDEIRELALRAIATEPLNARAFRLLAETSNDADQVRALMQMALQRSRRETVAAFWLLNDSFYRKDYKSALDYGDIVLRTRSRLGMRVLDYFAIIAEDIQGREMLVRQLLSDPTWRTEFFEALPGKTKKPETLLGLMTALQESGKSVTQKELEPYLNFLIKKDRIELAYNVWLQFLPKADLENIDLLTNASFEREPSGLPFDWRIGKGKNALAEIIPLAEEETHHVLHITFTDGRVQFPDIGQSITLKPGRYRFEGQLRGAINGRRGLRWRLRCLSRTKRILSETEMLIGKWRDWRVFRLEAEVPDLEECRGQELLLLHDSRSASEQLLSGEVWFSNLRLEHSENYRSQ